MESLFNEDIISFTEVYSQCCQSLSLSSNSWSRLLYILDSLVISLLCFLVNSRWSLLSCGLLLLLLGSSDGLLSLSLPDLGLLVPLGHDVLEGGSDDGSLELLGPLVPFLGDILLKTLLVLPPVEHGPGHLTGITLQKMSLVGSAGRKPEVLAINLDQRSAMAWVDLVPRVNTQLYLHDGLFFSCRSESSNISLVVLDLAINLD